MGQRYWLWTVHIVFLQILSVSCVQTLPRNCTEKFFNTKLDHFSYENSKTIRIRYLISRTEQIDCTKPVFLYIGGQNDIVSSVQEFGFIFEMAEYFGSKAVFMEHRYYGKSLPTLNEDKTINFNYLRISQVLGDVAEFITSFLSNVLRCPYAPIIVCGSSYSGALATWMRVKYPNLVKGAVVSSAPLMYFYNSTLDMTSFRAKTAEIYLQNKCSNKTVTEAWKVIRQQSKNVPNGLEQLNKEFAISHVSLLETEADQQYLIDYIRTALEQMAVFNYPYEQDFPRRLRNWPVNASCSLLHYESNDEWALLRKLKNVTDLYYGSGEKCIKPEVCFSGREEERIERQAKVWQECTEWIINKCPSSAGDDFIPNDCINCKTNSEAKISCVRQLANTSYSLHMFNPNYIRVEFGINFNSLTNIIFTNGKLDPWNTGAVTKVDVGPLSWQRGVYVFDMTNAASHLDFQQPNSCDPPSVTDTRRFIVTNIIPKILANRVEAFENLLPSVASTPITASCIHIYRPWQQIPLPSAVVPVLSTTSSPATTKNNPTNETTTSGAESNICILRTLAVVLISTSLLQLH